jgi:hypothetical protein
MVESTANRADHCLADGRRADQRFYRSEIIRRARFDAIEKRFDGVYARFDVIEVRLEKLESRSHDTKPIWERALAAITHTNLESVKSKAKPV